MRKNSLIQLLNYEIYKIFFWPQYCFNCWANHAQAITLILSYLVSFSCSLKRSLNRSYIIGVIAALFAVPAWGAESGPALTLITANEAGSEYGLSLQILVMMTVLAIIPSIIILMTSFTRIIIVLSLLRQAMGTGQTPPNQVLIGIAVFLTFFIMKRIKCIDFAISAYNISKNIVFISIAAASINYYIA